MPADKRLIEALDKGEVYSAYDEAYVPVVNVSKAGVTVRPNIGNPYGEEPIYCPLSEYGKTWALDAEEIPAKR